MSKMRTKIVALDQHHSSKYSRVAVELRLVLHGHYCGSKRPRDKHKLAHCRRIEELGFIAGQLGIPELSLCHRALSRDFVDVSRTWVFPIGCCPHSCRSQVVTLIVSVYSTVCTFKTRRVWCVRPNLRQGNWLYCTVSVASTAGQLRHCRGILKFLAKSDSKRAVHVYVGKVVGVGRHVWYLVASIVKMYLRLV